MTALAPLLQTFFTERLIRQRDASPHTIAAYRDTWRMLLGFAADRAGKPASQLDLGDVDAEVIAAFLEHLQTVRGNSVRTVTRGWPRSARCSGSPHSTTPSTPTPSAGCSRSHPNASTTR